MKNIILILLLLIPIFCFSQVRTIPTRFDPIVELNLPGTTIIGSPSIVGKEVTITDADDATNMTIIIRTPSADTSSNPTYPNLLTLGSVFKVNIQNVTSGDTVYIREDGLGVNGRIGSPGYPITKDTKLEFVYTTVGWVERKDYAETETFLTSFGEISNRNFNAGDRIRVRHSLGEAVYIVSNDSIARIEVNSSQGVRSTANGKYALLQPKANGFIDANDFQASPNNAGEDDTEINNAVQYAIWAKYWKVGFTKGGDYVIDDPIFLLYDKDTTDNDYDFFSFELSGIINNYGIANDNYVIFEHTSTSLPTVIMQKARQVTVQNISFQGTLPVQSFSALVTTTEPNQRNGSFRSNRWSPHSAICIDPFDDEVTGGNRYPGLDSYYGQTSNGGSSHVTMEGITIRGYIVGVMVNPSGGIQNGDNIKINNSSVQDCFSFWASGQGQSKGNVISNIYSLGGINIFIDCNNFGDLGGAPPFVENCNIAGSLYRFIEAIVNNVTIFRANNIFAESVFEIGELSIQSSWHGCRFSFAIHGANGIPGPSLHYKQTSGVANFKGCDFAYFSNGQYQFPFTFFTVNTARIKFEQCYFDGGRVYNTVYPITTIGDGVSEYISSNIKIENCNRYTKNGIVHYNGFADYNSTYTGEDYDLGAGPIWMESRHTLNSIPARSIPNTNPDMTISVTNADDHFLVDDVLFLNSGGPTQDRSQILGIVESVAGNNIVVTGVPRDVQTMKLNSDTTKVYIVDIWKSLRRSFGDFTSGNDTIKNVYNIAALSVGDFINTPNGLVSNSAAAKTRILEKGADWVRMSRAAVGNGNKELIQGRIYKARRNVNNTDDRYNNQISLLSWYVGDEMVLTDKDTSILVCTKSGVYGTDWEPEFSPITSQSYADLNLLEYTAGLIDGGKFSPALTLDSSLIIKSDNGLVRFEEEGGTPIGSFGASRPGNFGFLQWSEWFGILKGSIHQGISDFQDTTTFNNTSDPNARVIVNVPMEIDNGQDIVDETDQEFKVPFGRDKGQETDVNLNLGTVLARSGHMSFEYTSRVSSGAVANNVIWIDTLGQNIKHMLDIYITAIDESATYNVKVRTAGVDSIFIRDTLVSEYILQDDQTLHIKSIKTGGNNIYKVINPEKKGSYTNSSGSNQTVITITHNLGVTPNIIYITPTTDVGTWYVSNKNTTEIEITMSTGLANTASLQWFVDR